MHLRIDTRGKFTNYQHDHPLDQPSPTITAFGIGAGGLHWLEGQPMTVRISSKPHYAVPSMAEVAATPLHGLTAVSTFSGAGGSSTGYRMAGWRVLWANEFEPHAAQTYRDNHPDTILDERDVREITADEIRAAIRPADIDLLDGSPPCQSFSTAGPRTTVWGKAIQHADGTHQRSDDLFFEFVRLVGDLQPRSFIAENVRGLVTGAAKGMFKRIMAALTDCGYQVRARLLDAQWLGVPQHRKRIIIIGMRDDLGLSPPFPEPFGYRYSILDACPWLADITTSLASRQGGWEDVGGMQPRDLTRPFPTVQAGMPRTRLVQPSTRTGSPGHREIYRDLEDPAPTVTATISGARPMLTASNGHNFSEQELDSQQPAPTVTGRTSGHNAIRVKDDLPEKRRRLTILEIKRLCAFPDDYRLTGSYDRQWARLGNSVPPLMARAIGASLAEALLTLDGK